MRSKTTFGEKLNEYWIQGFQLNRGYIIDWNEMKSHFTLNGLRMNEHGPIITMNELKIVREASRLAEILANTQKYKNMTPVTDEQKRKARVFLTNLSILPCFTRTLSMQAFEEWVKHPDKFLEEIYQLDGTMKTRDLKIEKLVKDAIIFMQK